MAKRYDACAPRPKKDGGTFWHRVGTAWEGDKGIQVVLDSYPLPDAEGRCVVNLFEPRAQDGGPRSSGRVQNRQELDDDVPF